MKTGRLGTADSRLGSSLVLGAGAQFFSSQAQFAANQLFPGLQHSVDINIKMRYASNTLALSQIANIGLAKHAVNALTLSHSARSGLFALSAANSLTLSDAATYGRDLELDATNDLELLQSAVRSGTFSLSASNALALQQFADYSNKKRQATNTLSLSHTAIGNYSKVAINTLTLSHSAILGQIQRSAVNTLALSHTARNVLKLRSAVNVLSLSNAAHSNLKHLSAVNTLSISATASTPKTYHLSVVNALNGTEQSLDNSDPYNPIVVTKTFVLTHQAVISGSRSLLAQNTIALGFQDTANGVLIKVGALDRAASNTLSLSNQTWATKAKEAVNTLSLTHTAIGRAGKRAENALSLGHTASLLLVRTSTVVHTLSLSHSASPLLIRSGSDKTYNLSNPPVLIPASQVTFTHPFISPTLTLQLRAPSLDNIDRLAFQRISQESRGGTLIVFADPIWPKHKRLVIEFTALCEDEGQALLAFVEQSLGAEIGFTDWESRTWRGVIVNPQEPLVRNRPDVLTMQLELEAELV